MQLKELFTVATGEKVTERKFHRVLISSVCSMVLCMACLMSTTWAWFTVSIDNKENIIQVAEWSLDVSITPAAAQAETEEEIPPVQCNNGVYTLQEGVYDINIRFFSDAQGNDLDRAKVYLIMVENVGETETKYAATFTLSEDGSYVPIQKIYEVGEGKETTLSFYFTRMNPQINDDLMTAVFEAEEKEATQDTTASTEKTTGTTEGES